MSINKAWWCSECDDMECGWDKPYTHDCPICNEEFCSQDCVESHILREHPDSEEAKELDEGI